MTTRRALSAWCAVLGVAAGACTGEQPAHTPSDTRPDVVLVSVDTLRADRVGGPLTPTINAIGSRGARFLSARTTVPLTLPAHVSLMTGTLPPVHGVRLNGVHRFDGSHPTLARLFKDAGYATAAFVGAFVLDRQFGLDAGFDTYDDRIPRSTAAPLLLEAERPAGVVADRAMAWLKSRPAGTGRQPFFLWIHFYDPHAPYTPPAEARARAGGDAYGGEVAYVDAEIGRIMAALRQPDDRARTLIAVVGDHGESLGEHGERTHGMLLYEGALRIPLVMQGPGVGKGERRELVSLIDVAPTLLRLASLPVPKRIAGRDLFTGTEHPHEIYAETQYPQVAGWSPLAALVEDRWKLVATDGAEDELYDLQLDAGERHNQSAQQPATVAAVRSRLAAIRATGSGSAVATAPSADALARLRSLGYVATSGSATSAGSSVNPATQIAAWASFEDALPLLTAGQPAAALAALAPLAMAHPDAPVFQSVYARALSESGRHREALSVYRQAVRRWPRDSMLYHDFAVAAGAAGDRDEAVRAERAAIAVDAGNSAAHNGLGLLLIERGQTDGARQAFERASVLDKTSAEYRVNLGNARRAAGDMAEAEAAYREALDRDGAFAGALNGLGVLLVQQNHPADALPFFERALKADPAFWEAHLNLGIANQQAGRLDAARAAYRAVLGAPPRFARERRAASDLLAALAPER
ncbi:MAG: sulfatase-like hydrolase/transferase [Acidobacteriota bacterium]